jgi:hypothetical protein
MTEQSPFIQALVLNAVRRYVAASIRSGSYISASACADEILKTYPNCLMSEKELADEITMAAAKAGVAVQIGRARKVSAPGRPATVQQVA